MSAERSEEDVDSVGDSGSGGGDDRPNNAAQPQPQVATNVAAGWCAPTFGQSQAQAHAPAAPVIFGGDVGGFGLQGGAPLFSFNPPAAHTLFFTPLIGAPPRTKRIDPDYYWNDLNYLEKRLKDHRFEPCFCLSSYGCVITRAVLQIFVAAFQDMGEPNRPRTLVFDNVKVNTDDAELGRYFQELFGVLPHLRTILFRGDFRGFCGGGFFGGGLFGGGGQWAPFLSFSSLIQGLEKLSGKIEIRFHHLSMKEDEENDATQLRTLGQRIAAMIDYGLFGGSPDYPGVDFSSCSLGPAFVEGFVSLCPTPPFLSFEGSTEILNAFAPWLKHNALMSLVVRTQDLNTLCQHLEQRSGPLKNIEVKVTSGALLRSVSAKQLFRACRSLRWECPLADGLGKDFFNSLRSDPNQPPLTVSKLELCDTECLWSRREKILEKDADSLFSVLKDNDSVEELRIGGIIGGKVFGWEKHLPELKTLKRLEFDGQDPEDFKSSLLHNKSLEHLSLVSSRGSSSRSDFTDVVAILDRNKGLNRGRQFIKDPSLNGWCDLAGELETIDALVAFCNATVDFLASLSSGPVTRRTHKCER